MHRYNTTSHWSVEDFRKTILLDLTVQCHCLLDSNISTGGIEYVVNIMLHGVSNNKKACTFKSNWTKENATHMNFFNVIPPWLNVSIKCSVQELELDQVACNAGCPS